MKGRPFQSQDRRPSSATIHDDGTLIAQRGGMRWTVTDPEAPMRLAETVLGQARAEFERQRAEGYALDFPNRSSAFKFGPVLQQKPEDSKP